MPNTCSNCSHWSPVDNTSLRVPREIVGQCRGGPPCGDFRWPKTTAGSYCSMHSANAPQVNFATALDDARAVGRREGEALLLQLRASGVAVVSATELLEHQTRFRQAAEKAGIAPGEAVPEGDPRLKLFEQTRLFDDGAGAAKSSGQPERNGGPAVAVDAAAPQSTAATEPVTSPAQVRAPSADGTARGVSRSAPRRTKGS